MLHLFSYFNIVSIPIHSTEFAIYTKVDDISAGSTTEAEEIIFVQLHAGVPVFVKWAAGHAVWQYPQPIVFGSLPQSDSCLDGFKYAHYLASI